MRCDSLKQIRGNLKFFFLCDFDSYHVSYSHKSFWSAFCYNCVFIITQESVELQRRRTIAKFWRVPSSCLIFLLKQQCTGFGFHLSYVFHFARKSSTHLWPLSALNSALFHLVTQQSHRLSQSQKWCHRASLCCLFSNWSQLKECCTWISGDIT